MSRVLIRGVNWIGDAVMTLPTIHALKQALSDKDLYLMVKQWVYPVFEKNPFIKEIIPYRDDFKGIAGKFRAAKRLRKEHFQRAILLQNALDAALIAFLSGIPERIGYNRDGRGIFLTQKIPFDDRAASLHHCLYYLNILKYSGLEPVYRHPWIHLSLDERVGAQEYLKDKKRPVVLLNPGATFGSAKRWPAGCFSRLGEMIIRELGGSVLISGSRQEKPIAEEIARKIPDREQVTVIAGRSSLRELIAILSQVDAVVTNDSGPMHLAYAVGTPLVALFGSTSPELTGPPSFVNPSRWHFKEEVEFSVSESVIRKPLPCSPCFRRDCPEGHTRCLNLIEVDEVFEELKGVLPKRKAVFFDRDGTLCKDAHYLNRMDDLEIFPDTEKLARLKDEGYMIVGISNQSGVARGLIEESFVKRVNDIFIQKYDFDAFYYCPHHPEEHCACRKPSPGMLLRARAELGIDLKRSIMVGDKELDIELARAVGCKGFFVKTGQGQGCKEADRHFDNLSELVEYIINQPF